MKKTSLTLVIALFVILGTVFSQGTKPQDNKTNNPSINPQHTPPPPPADTPDAPRLDFIGNIKSDTYDWKDVSPKDSPLKTIVVIKNTGKSNLIISEVKPGCGCTTAPLSRDTIAPGDTASLSITLNIGGNQNSVTKTVRVSSNDPKSPKFLWLKANVIHPIQILPNQYFTFGGELKVGSEDTASVKVKNNSNIDITLSNFEVSPVTVLCNMTKPVTLKPGEDVSVSVRVKPDKAGAYQMSIKMKTTHPDYQILSINGYGNVKESPVFQNK